MYFSDDELECLQATAIAAKVYEKRDVLFLGLAHTVVAGYARYSDGLTQLWSDLRWLNASAPDSETVAFSLDSAGLPRSERLCDEGRAAKRSRPGRPAGGCTDK
jgi:hypothetical protein